MTNMSYCRFENTLEALQECGEALYESSDPLSGLSPSEKEAAKRLIRLCVEISADFGEYLK